MRVLLDCPNLRVIPNTYGFSYPAEWKGFIDYLKHHPSLESICGMPAKDWWHQYDTSGRHARGFRERAARWAAVREASEALTRENWRLPSAMIDGDSATSAAVAGPLDWDLGKSHALSGIAYQPPLDGTRDGAIGRFKVFGSSDGTTWRLITDDNFIDVEKATDALFLPFPETVSARHIRFLPVYCYSSETERFSSDKGLVAELRLYRPQGE